MPDPVVKRLSLYLRQLEQLLAQRVPTVSSRQLADSLHVTPSQVRKDLAYFGQFGRPGVGYRVEALSEQLRHILGTDRTWKVIVVGAGDLGRALLRYRSFRGRGFQLVAAFDVAMAKVGKPVGQVPVYHVKELPRIIRRHGVRLAILTVPAEAAQELTDLLCRCGVQGVLNFAPTTLRPPKGLAVAVVDLAAHLEQLSFQVTGQHAP